MKLLSIFAAFILYFAAIKSADATICTEVKNFKGSDSPQPGGEPLYFVASSFEPGSNRPLEFKLDIDHHAVNQRFPYDSNIIFNAKIQYYSMSRLYTVSITDRSGNPLDKDTGFFVEYRSTRNSIITFRVNNFGECTFFTLPNDFTVVDVKLYLA